MRLSPESVAALESAARWAAKMFIHHAKERANWSGLLHNPNNWRPPQHNKHASWVRIQKTRAEQHAKAVGYREQYNAIMRDIARQGVTPP